MRRSWHKDDKQSSIADHKWVKPNGKIEERNAFSRQKRISEQNLPEEERYEINEEAVLDEVRAMYDDAIEAMEKHIGGKK